ncbi:MAG: hypothetical protein IJ644_04070, partial [Oscillospiraceae bacterium]|nr:hypothetical protein [Oscillospiraceae bacterium]
MKKLLCLLLACLMLTGCASQKQKTSYTEEELPYGATMKSDKNSYTVPMTWDRRFFEPEQISAVADYLGAIEQNNPELYASVALPLYTDYQVNEVYDYQNVEELVNALHEGLLGQLADDFRMDMILVNEISDDRNSGGLQAMLKLLDGISEEKPFSETIQNAWSLNLEWEFSYNNGEGS